MPHILTQYDNLDTRREACVLLDKLKPAGRLAWLTWCCRQIPLREGVGLRPTRGTRDLAERAEREDSDDLSRLLTSTVYHDFWILCTQQKLDGWRALLELERLARKAR